MDARSDVFAFGCVVYEMSTGTRPFPGHNATTILGAILRSGEETFEPLEIALPKAVERIVRRCLEREPENRFSSAAEIGAELIRLREWVRNDALPELARLAEQTTILEEGPDAWHAFELAREIEALVPDDPLLAQLWPRFTEEVGFDTDPRGASVSVKYYGTPDAAWTYIGTTPISSARCPFGISRIQLELEDHRTGRDVIWVLPKRLSDALTEVTSYRLHASGDLPDEMEAVPGGAVPVFMPGLDHLEAEPTAAFLMDRHPVTNREFRAFVDAGGYEADEYWIRPFRERDVERSREEAKARFVDTVGRPGPASWEMGQYPAGDDDLPVTGISWYEADAYARWSGKELPTLFHWNRVAFTAASSQIIPTANLSGRALLPVGATSSVNRYGVHDLAGNVREWAWNASNRPGERFILGGGWNDSEYAFTDAYAQSAFDRSATNGFRCVRPVEPEPNRDNLTRDIELPFRDFRAEESVPDEVFDFFLRQFHYDKTPLDARVEEEHEDEAGTRQLISFDAAYGGERMLAYLCLPRTGTPPYQTVVLFPGSLAIHVRTMGDENFSRTDFIRKSGRALLMPIYKGTYQRGGELKSDYPEATSFYKDYVVMWGKDLARSIDYVETRDEIDAERVAYLGLSWGGAQGSIMPAVEKRIRANVLYVAGLNFQRALPEVDQINYVTRVTQPTLMLNGELDFFFPVETSQKPMFDLLGTPPEHKKRLTYPRGHTVPRTEMIKETLAWLDRYLGPV